MYTDGDVFEITRKITERWKTSKPKKKPNLRDIVRMVLDELKTTDPKDDNIVPEPVEIPAGARLFTNRYARNLSLTKHVLETDTKVSILETKMMRFGGESCVALCFVHNYQVVWVAVDNFIDNTFI